MECFTCKITEAVDKSYPVRNAQFGESSGRCFWHAWDDDGVFICSRCGTPQFFEKVAWCRKTDHLICTECASSRTVKEKFWFWKEYTIITCPYCREDHPTLNYQEYTGEHPWQANPFQCKQFPIWYPDGALVTKKDITPQEKKEKKEKKSAKVRCPYCKTVIPITKPGTYKCPHCSRSFTVKKKH